MRARRLFFHGCLAKWLNHASASAAASFGIKKATQCSALSKSSLRPLQKGVGEENRKGLIDQKICGIHELHCTLPVPMCLRIGRGAWHWQQRSCHNPETSIGLSSMKQHKAARSRMKQHEAARISSKQDQAAWSRTNQQLNRMERH